MNHDHNSDSASDIASETDNSNKPQTENSQAETSPSEKTVYPDSREEVNEGNCRFSPGEPLKFARVRFPGHARSYPFLVGNRKLVYGQKVMAMSDRGMAVGYVNSFVYELPFKKSMLPLRSITRIATAEDIIDEKETYDKQKTTETLCQRLIDKHNLDMNLTHVEFTQFGKKVVFYFVAPARVDFRSLVRDLVAELKLRIELRQISVRDRSASMGALGPCGRELCCSSFLSRYGNVSIKMAKNQNLTLNYSKLNGVCGQLKCCLQYEDEVYSQKRKALPKEGSFIETTTGEKGKIFRLHILSEQFDVLTEKGKIRRYTESYYKRRLKAEDVKMPDRFDNISDETATVIGLNEVENEKRIAFEREMLELKVKAGQYASEIFEDLTGVSGEEQLQTPQQAEVGSERKMLEKEISFDQQLSDGQDGPAMDFRTPPVEGPGAEADSSLTTSKANQDDSGQNNDGPRKKGPRRNPRKGNRRRGPRTGKKKPSSNS